MSAAEILEETDPGDDIRSGSITPPGGVVYGSSDLIDAIASRVLEELHSDAQKYGGGGGGRRPPDVPPIVKTILGDTPKGWGTWFIRALFAAGVAFGAWYTFVNDGLKDRPTKSEAASMIKASKDAHEDHGRHRDLDDLVRGNSEQLKVLSDIQIRQTAILEGHEKDINKVETDVKRLRRR